MLADIASYAFELEGHFDNFLRLFVGVDERTQLGLFFERFSQRHARLERNEFAKFVSQCIGLALHSRNVSHHRFCCKRTERNDLRHSLFTIQLGDVLDHTIASLHAEIDVKIRHRNPFWIQESLEEKIIFKRV